MPRKDRKRLKLIQGVCVFCNTKEDNELKYGKIYHHNGITTHYYCLLLSSNMQQKGSDDEGILGFLKFDIMNELRRGKRLSCIYCKRTGATLNCCNTKCKKAFHLPCGLKSGSLHQYFGEFRSYCVNHRPKPQADERIKSQVPEQLLCYICYDNVDRNNLFQTLWAPCCKKNAWFHRDCVQQLAMSAGYFFKCPLCNNKKEFQKAMLDDGIFIPCQDASWELVPNAFQELLYRHNRCDAPRCKCSKGRRYTSSNPKWELILCRTCGSQGVHVACGNLKWLNTSWDCAECTSILNKTIDDNTRDGRIETNHTDNSSSNDNYEQSDCDSDDSDISVGTEEPIYGPTPWPNVSELPQVRIRPGPRSFKLKQQKMMSEICAGNSGRSSGASSPHSDPSSFGESSRGSLITDGDGFNDKEFCVDDDSNAAMSGERDQGDAQGKTQDSSANILLSLLRTEPGGQGDVVTIESDDEPMDTQEVEENPKIIESILKTNDGLRIPVHSAPSSLPHDLRIVGDVRLPNANSSAVSSSIDDASQNGGASIGHIVVGPTDDPMIIGNFQMPDQTISESVPDNSEVNSSIIQPQTLQSSVITDSSEPQNDSIMQIKITNVTSLPPEVFASEPESINQEAPLITEQQDFIDVESENEEIAYHLSMASQLRQSIADGSRVIRSNSVRRAGGENPEKIQKTPEVERSCASNQDQNNSPQKPDNNSLSVQVNVKSGGSQPSTTSFSPGSSAPPLKTYQVKKKTPKIVAYKAGPSPVVKEVSGIVQSIQTTMRVYQGRKKAPSPEPVVRPQIAVVVQPPQPQIAAVAQPQQIVAPERRQVARKRQRIAPKGQEPIHHLNGGVCLDNAAIVSVMGKEFVIPLANQPAIKVNGTWKPQYDGDAGTLPAEVGVTGHHRGHAESVEIQQCHCQSRCFHQRESHNSNVSSSDDTSSCASSNYRDRLRENEVYLKDLKFKVSSHERLKMTVRDGLTVDFEIDTARKRRPGPKSKTSRRFSLGSSLIRRLLMSSRSRTERETNHVQVKEPINEALTSIFAKSEEDAVKENVAPLSAVINSFPSTPERKKKRMRSNSGDSSISSGIFKPERKYYSSPHLNPERPGSSRDGLKDLSHSFVNNRSDKIVGQSAKSKKSNGLYRRASLLEMGGKKINVSIELSRIQPLIISKPSLFCGRNGMKNLMKSKSFDDLKNSEAMDIFAGTLWRSKSLDNLSSSCILNNFDINIHNCMINSFRKGQKRRRSFEKHDCVR